MGRPRLSHAACRRCLVVKEKTPEYFPYRNKKRGWLSSWCHECIKAYKIENKERANKLQRIRRRAKPQTPPSKTCIICGGAFSATTSANTCSTECRINYTRQQKCNDKAIRKKRLRNAMPVWADQKQIRKIYRKARKLRESGAEVEVDHIIPISGNTVSGLHVAENLRIIPSYDNRKKGNHFSIEHDGVK